MRAPAAVCILIGWLVFQSAVPTHSQSQPLKASICELSTHPQTYIGRMVEVRAAMIGSSGPMHEAEYQETPCRSYMGVVLELPSRVKPKPAFELVSDADLQRFEQATRQFVNIQATFEGRFDAAFTWRDGKQIIVAPGSGFGKAKRYGGRIVLRKVSEVVARPLYPL